MEIYSMITESGCGIFSLVTTLVVLLSSLIHTAIQLLFMWSSTSSSSSQILDSFHFLYSFLACRQRPLSFFLWIWKQHFYLILQAIKFHHHQQNNKKKWEKSLDFIFFIIMKWLILCRNGKKKNLKKKLKKKKVETYN
jgi:glycerol-3-phosphate acyltransferase PlsY